MQQFIIVEKPENISYETIHDVLYSAHEENRKKGSIMTTSLLSGEQLKKRIGAHGKCWVVIDDEKVVGTASVRYVQRNNWYAKGMIPDYILVGVIPEYQGRGISRRLVEEVFNFAKENGNQVIELDTAENNVHAIEVYKHQGFRLVSYKAPRADHYSVVMVKWIEGCPYSEIYCKFRFNLTRLLVRLRYKVGGEKRF